MGYSKSVAIEEANRDEAQEAIELIKKSKEFFDNYAYRENSARLAKAIELIDKFSQKHQPEAQRWK
jgi:hypothetical protein